MNERNRSEDRAWRELFAARHRREDPPVPPFETVMRRAERRRPPGRRQVMQLAAAAAILAALGLGTFLWRDTYTAPSDRELLDIAQSLPDWRGPLDGLLEAPGGDWWRRAPELQPATTTIPKAENWNKEML